MATPAIAATSSFRIGVRDRKSLLRASAQFTKNGALRIVRELLANAFDAGATTIHWCARECASRHVLLIVRDNGCGIGDVRKALDLGGTDHRRDADALGYYGEGLTLAVDSADSAVLVTSTRNTLTLVYVRDSNRPVQMYRDSHGDGGATATATGTTVALALDPRTVGYPTSAALCADVDAIMHDVATRHCPRRRAFVHMTLTHVDDVVRRPELSRACALRWLQLQFRETPCVQRGTYVDNGRIAAHPYLCPLDRQYAVRTIVSCTGGRPLAYVAMNKRRGPIVDQRLSVAIYYCGLPMSGTFDGRKTTMVVASRIYEHAFVEPPLVFIVGRECVRGAPATGAGGAGAKEAIFTDRSRVAIDWNSPLANTIEHVVQKEVDEVLYDIRCRTAPFTARAGAERNSVTMLWRPRTLSPSSSSSSTGYLWPPRSPPSLPPPPRSSGSDWAVVVCPKRPCGRRKWHYDPIRLLCSGDYTSNRDAQRLFRDLERVADGLPMQVDFGYRELDWVAFRRALRPFVRPPGRVRFNRCGVFTAAAWYVIVQMALRAAQATSLWRSEHVRAYFVATLRLSDSTTTADNSAASCASECALLGEYYVCGNTHYIAIVPSAHAEFALASSGCRYLDTGVFTTLVSRMILTALHEITHALGYEKHDQTFVTVCEALQTQWDNLYAPHTSTDAIAQIMCAVGLVVRRNIASWPAQWCPHAAVAMAGSNERSTLADARVSAPPPPLITADGHINRAARSYADCFADRTRTRVLVRK